MKRLGLSLLAMCSLWLASDNGSKLLADEKDSKCCGNQLQQKSDPGPGPWVCPLFVLYDYGNGEYLYYGERREADCYDEPQAAGLFGSWELPKYCELNQCLPGYQLEDGRPQTRNKHYLRMNKPAERPGYVHARPAKERTFGYEDPNLSFITFHGLPFGQDRMIVAKVNVVEIFVNDERLPSGRQVLKYCAWETDGSDLNGLEPLPVTVFSSMPVTSQDDESVQGHVLVAKMLHPLRRKPVDIYVLLGEKSE